MKHTGTLLKDANPTSPPVFCATGFGAAGDGVADDTAAIQRAIDACAAAGGGRVLLRNGRFLGSYMDNRQKSLHLGMRLVSPGDRGRIWTIDKSLCIWVCVW